MITKLSNSFEKLYLRFMPDAFVFALLLTIVTSLAAFFWVDASPLKIISSWYDGFFDLLSFTMQVVLMIITGFSIALSPSIKRAIDYLSSFVNSPGYVYLITVFVGTLLSMVSFGWIVVTSVLARALAERVKGVNYPFLVACVYFSANTWVLGLSSSIPLLLNTEKNFLVETGMLPDIISTSHTLGSSLNAAMMGLLIIGSPIVLYMLRPKTAKNKELSDLLIHTESVVQKSIKDEAEDLKLPFKSLSDSLNNSKILQFLIGVSGLVYIVYHFSTKGLDLNFNIMIFLFLMIGMLLHRSPMRYVISMKRSSKNISGILYQYPFYAGIMGIMLYTGLGEHLGQVLASIADENSYPFFAYVTGAFINFAIPSAGGEFAVLGPSLINAINEIGANQSANELTEMIARASMSVAYGESMSNILQPFFLLIVLPVMGAGVKIQARDVMGYLVLPFLLFFCIQSIMVVWWPM